MKLPGIIFSLIVNDSNSIEIVDQEFIFQESFYYIRCDRTTYEKLIIQIYCQHQRD